MRGFRDSCIFCGRDLPPLNRRGKGEHIIPEVLLGTITTKDVCKDCNSYLGTNVDSLWHSHSDLCQAILDLELPELHEKIYDRAELVTTDSTTGKILPSKSKRGRVRIVRHKDEDGVVWHGDHNSALKEVRTKLQRGGRKKDSGSSESIDPNHLESLKKLNPGEILEIPGSNLAIRKGTSETKFRLPHDPTSFNRLISKIAYESAFLLFRPEVIPQVVDVLEELAKNALLGEEVSTGRIGTPPSDEEELPPGVAHMITAWDWEPTHCIDISLFHAVNFRVIFPVSPDAKLPPWKFRNRRINGFRIGMALSNTREKIKLWGVQHKGKRSFVRMDGTGIL